MKETPKYPVPCVRLIVTNKEGKLLLLQRAVGTIAAGEWSLPGGKIDYGQSPEDAAIRELQEETGLEAQNLEFLFYLNSHPLKPGGMHALNLYFLCNVDGVATINEESQAMEWLTVGEALSREIVFGGHEGLQLYFDKEG